MLKIETAQELLPVLNYNEVYGAAMEYRESSIYDFTTLYIMD
jgi:hypothetical protein